jgi:transcriptional regulator with XRE-family HTH domain
MDTQTREAAALNRAVAAELRSLLARRRMRQSALARRMGVTEVWLSRRLREVQSMSLDDLEAMCRALGVAPAELVASAVRGTWLPTLEKVAPPDRATSTHPKGRSHGHDVTAPPNGAPGPRRSRRRGTPAVVPPSQAAA